MRPHAPLGGISYYLFVTTLLFVMLGVLMVFLLGFLFSAQDRKPALAGLAPRPPD